MNRSKPAPDPARQQAQADELELIVVRCQLGQRDAFEDLIQCHARPLLAHLRRVSGDEQAARDLAQEVWLKVLQGIGGLNDTRRFRSWLFSIAHRKLMDRFRRQYREAIDQTIDVESLREEIDPHDRSLLHDQLMMVLNLLPITERETLHLFYMEGLSLEETAECLSIPVGTVKSRLFRGRQMLRDHKHLHASS